MARNIFLYCILFIIIAMFIGCQPVYRTFYTYTPPKSFQGKQCVNNCLPIKQQCESTQAMEYQSCLNRAQSAFDSCESRKVYRYDSKKGETRCVRNCFCSRGSCSQPNSYICDERYNRCYTNCGGEVLSYQKCVSNCEDEQY